MKYKVYIFDDVNDQLEEIKKAIEVMNTDIVNTTSALYQCMNTLIGNKFIQARIEAVEPVPIKPINSGRYVREDAAAFKLLLDNADMSINHVALIDWYLRSDEYLEVLEEIANTLNEKFGNDYSNIIICSGYPGAIIKDPEDSEPKKRLKRRGIKKDFARYYKDYDNGEDDEEKKYAARCYKTLVEKLLDAK